jgi:hypothetical protein
MVKAIVVNSESDLCGETVRVTEKNRLESVLVHPDQMASRTAAEKHVSLRLRPECGALGMQMNKMPVIPWRIACRGKNAIYVAWV